ncbi:tail fiber protein, partial [Flammeovirga sp. OC4]|uniref:tail fiber protein n=1 Tax=Flammeovirga sp. OC4 TaxID=1382345 RepID=UPI0005C46F88
MRARLFYLLLIFTSIVFNEIKSQDFSLNFQTASLPGERVIATIDAGNIGTYEGLQIVGNIVDCNGNWGFALPNSSNFMLYVKFSGGLAYGIQQDVKLSNITLRLRKVNDSVIHLTANTPKTHKAFVINFTNLKLTIVSPEITLGNPKILNDEGELIVEEPVYGTNVLGNNGILPAPVIIDYNEGEKQLALTNKGDSVLFHQMINDDNNIVFENNSSNGGYNFTSNVGGNGSKSVVFIDGNQGNVGIGTKTPEFELDVRGYLCVGEGNRAGAIHFKSPVASNAGFVGFENSEEGHNFAIGSKHGGGYLTFWTNQGVHGYGERMRITKDGFVGIGTDEPDSKLTVKGKIHAQEVKVTTSAGTVPDYVFKEDYA